jgi:hypothetical protein
MVPPVDFPLVSFCSRDLEAEESDFQELNLQAVQGKRTAVLGRRLNWLGDCLYRGERDVETDGEVAVVGSSFH